MALTCQQKESLSLVLSPSPSRPSANSVFFALPFGRQGSLLILLACLASGITAGQHLGVCMRVCVWWECLSQDMDNAWAKTVNVFMCVCVCVHYSDSEWGRPSILSHVYLLMDVFKCKLHWCACILISVTLCKSQDCACVWKRIQCRTFDYDESQNHPLLHAYLLRTVGKLRKRMHECIW